jgi:lipopolysaccharide export system protein LptA
VLAVGVVGVYSWRHIQARRAQELAPPPVPQSVEKRSAGFSFSKVEGERTLFTVRASRTTEFKEGGKARLEEVEIIIYGRAGLRHDVIRTRECDYTPSTSLITCKGEVQMDLQSAEAARRGRKERVIHIGTANVTFHRESGELRTDRPVVFRFPHGHGRAVGATYAARAGVVRLMGEVEAQLYAGAGAEAKDALSVTGGALEILRDSRTVRLLAPVRARQGARELECRQIELLLDSDFRARRLLATGQPQFRSREARGEVQAAADEFSVAFHPQGWLTGAEAAGGVSAVMKSADGTEQISAERMTMAFEAPKNLLRAAEARGNVIARSEAISAAGRETRRLQTQALRVEFAAGRGRQARHVTRAETLEPGVLDLLAAGESTRVEGRRMAAIFGERGALRQVDVTERAQLERRLAARPVQHSASRQMRITFDAAGNWARAEQSGSVRLREGERTAQGDRAVFDNAEGGVTISGNAQLSDGASLTVAPRFTFYQRTGELRGEGGVRSTYFNPDAAGVPGMVREPAHLTAEHLLASREPGRATYSGRARLWQGEHVLNAESIELFQKEERLEARGGVNALFVQVPAAGSQSRQSVIWQARAARMIYWSEEGRARLEGAASAQSSLGSIRGDTLELFVVPAANGKSGRQLAKAVATGGVTVEQGDRHGSAERGEYLAPEGRFTLSGGKPTLFDAVLGTTTGRQLTFFLADDRILVDSEEGSRTLSRHRVGK